MSQSSPTKLNRVSRNKAGATVCSEGVTADKSGGEVGFSPGGYEGKKMHRTEAPPTVIGKTAGFHPEEEEKRQQELLRQKCPSGTQPSVQGGGECEKRSPSPRSSGALIESPKTPGGPSLAQARPRPKTRRRRSPTPCSSTSTRGTSLTRSPKKPPISSRRRRPSPSNAESNAESQDRSSSEESARGPRRQANVQGGINQSLSFPRDRRSKKESSESAYRSKAKERSLVNDKIYFKGPKTTKKNPYSSSLESDSSVSPKDRSYKLDDGFEEKNSRKGKSEGRSKARRSLENSYSRKDQKPRRKIDSDGKKVHSPRKMPTLDRGEYSSTDQVCSDVYPCRDKKGDKRTIEGPRSEEILNLKIGRKTKRRDPSPSEIESESENCIAHGSSPGKLEKRGRIKDGKRSSSSPDGSEESGPGPKEIGKTKKESLRGYKKSRKNEKDTTESEDTTDNVSFEAGEKVRGETRKRKKQEKRTNVENKEKGRTKSGYTNWRDGEVKGNSGSFETFSDDTRTDASSSEPRNTSKKKYASPPTSKQTVNAENTVNFSSSFTEPSESESELRRRERSKKGQKKAGSSAAVKKPRLSGGSDGGDTGSGGSKIIVVSKGENKQERTARARGGADNTLLGKDKSRTVGRPRSRSAERIRGTLARVERVRGKTVDRKRSRSAERTRGGKDTDKKWTDALERASYEIMCTEKALKSALKVAKKHSQQSSTELLAGNLADRPKEKSFEKNLQFKTDVSVREPSDYESSSYERMPNARKRWNRAHPSPKALTQRVRVPVTEEYENDYQPKRRGRKHVSYKEPSESDQSFRPGHNKKPVNLLKKGTGQTTLTKAKKEKKEGSCFESSSSSSDSTISIASLEETCKCKKKEPEPSPSEILKQMDTMLKGRTVKLWTLKEERERKEKEQKEEERKEKEKLKKQEKSKKKKRRSELSVETTRDTVGSNLSSDSDRSKSRTLASESGRSVRSERSSDSVRSVESKPRSAVDTRSESEIEDGDDLRRTGSSLILEHFTEKKLGKKEREKGTKKTEPEVKPEEEKIELKQPETKPEECDHDYAQQQHLQYHQQYGTAYDPGEYQFQNYQQFQDYRNMQQQYQQQYPQQYQSVDYQSANYQTPCYPIPVPCDQFSLHGQYPQQFQMQHYQPNLAQYNQTMQQQQQLQQQQQQLQQQQQQLQQQQPQKPVEAPAPPEEPSISDTSMDKQSVSDLGEKDEEEPEKEREKTGKPDRGERREAKEERKETRQERTETRQERKETRQERKETREERRELKEERRESKEEERRESKEDRQPVGSAPNQVPPGDTSEPKEDAPSCKSTEEELRKIEEWKKQEGSSCSCTDCRCSSSDEPPRPKKKIVFADEVDYKRRREGPPGVGKTNAYEKPEPPCSKKARPISYLVAKDGTMRVRVGTNRTKTEEKPSPPPPAIRNLGEIRKAWFKKAIKTAADATTTKPSPD